MNEETTEEMAAQDAPVAEPVAEPKKKPLTEAQKMRLANLNKANVALRKHRRELAEQKRQKELARQQDIDQERAEEQEVFEGVNSYPDESKNDYERDIQWVYSRLGMNHKKGWRRNPPSHPAAKMLVWANKEPEKFFARYREWLKSKEDRDNNPDQKELAEDEKETLAQLHRLSKEIAPDVALLLKEAAELWPEQFTATMAELGWVRAT